MPCEQPTVHGPEEKKKQPPEQPPKKPPEQPPKQPTGIIETVKDNPLLVAGGLGIGALALSKRKE